MKNHLDIILGLTALIVVIYRVFKTESIIYNTIDDLEKRVNERINSLERSFALHVAIYAERKEQVDYLLHANEEQIDHVKIRLLGDIKELRATLNHKPQLDES